MTWPGIEPQSLTPTIMPMDLTHCWKDTGVYTFPKGLNLKMNQIAQLEFKLAYFEAADQHFPHYTTRTFPNTFEVP